MLDLDDTIVAIASPSGSGARGIVRLSGNDALAICQRVFCFPETSEKVGKRPYAAQVTLNDDATSVKILATKPLNLYVWPGKQSYTRQPIVEIHGQLNAPQLDELLLQITHAGARLAKPGEFTMRAFAAGRMDLLQAEAVLGVIDAESEKNLATALRQLAGGISQPLHTLRSDLLNLVADLEAGLDFVDEDIEFVSHEQVIARLTMHAEQLEKSWRQLDARSTNAELPRVVLHGLPNVGKSQLFNALVGRDAAIVSPQAGTTRDYLSQACEFSGVRIELIDTAGVQETNDGIEQASQHKTHEQREQATLQVFCFDLSGPLNEHEFSHLIHYTNDKNKLLVGTKADLPSVWPAPRTLISTSAKTGQGIAELRAAVALKLNEQSGDFVATSGARCRESLRLANESLERALNLAKHKQGDELIVAEVRVALDELGQILGQIYTNDLLDRIFSRFCIGK